MGKAFIIDVAKCSGCRNCQIACKDEHVDNDWSPWAKPQPDTGQFWTRVDEQVRGQVPKVRISYTVHMCQHCENAPCMAAAPEAVYRRDDGLIIIDPVKAKGQKAIVEACTAGAVSWNEALGLPQKCTGCAHLLDDGWSVPRCVDVCATGALTYVDEADVPADAVPMPAVAENHPHVYYRNIPKRWVYGVLVDRGANEVIIGTKVSLVDAEGTTVAEVDTDEFGEFRFKELDENAYTVRAQVASFEEVVLTADTSEGDVVLGDIFLKAVA